MRAGNWLTTFPFLFGGTFIEAYSADNATKSFALFPFLFGGTFIEALQQRT